MDSIRDLKRLLYERTQALRRRDDVIEILEKALEERDATIRYLQNEIDKFRQIVDFSLASGAIGPGQRSKRQAISAEPLTKDSRVIVKFQKPQRYRIRHFLFRSNAIFTYLSPCIEEKLSSEIYLYRV